MDNRRHSPSGKNRTGPGYRVNDSNAKLITFKRVRLKKMSQTPGKSTCEAIRNDDGFTSMPPKHVPDAPGVILSLLKRRRKRGPCH